MTEVINKPTEQYQTIRKQREVLHVTEPGTYRFHGRDIPVDVAADEVACDFYLFRADEPNDVGEREIWIIHGPKFRLHWERAQGLRIDIDIDIDGPLTSARAKVLVDGKPVGLIQSLSFEGKVPFREEGNVTLEMQQLELQFMETKLGDLKERFQGARFEMIPVPTNIVVREP
jgi:hypothetical protein